MKKLYIILPLTLILCFMVGCQKAEEATEKPVVNVEADVEALKAIMNTYSEAINSGDVDSLMTIMTEDVVAMPPNFPVFKGKNIIRKGNEMVLEQFNMEESIVIDEIEVSCDLAFVRATVNFNQIPKEGGEIKEGSNKAIWIFKRQDNGSWKSSHSIWNSNKLRQAPNEKK